MTNGYALIQTHEELVKRKFKDYPEFLEGLGHYPAKDRMMKVTDTHYYEYRHFGDGIWGLVIARPLNTLR